MLNIYDIQHDSAKRDPTINYLKMAKARNLLYVGGLEDEVTNDILFAAFIPFGAIRSVDIPRDFKESMFSLPVMIINSDFDKIILNCIR